MLFHPDLTEQMQAGGCHFVLRDIVMFVGQQFLTNTPTDEAFNYFLSSLSWGFPHSFLNLWRVVCICVIYIICHRKYKEYE